MKDYLEKIKEIDLKINRYEGRKEDFFKERLAKAKKHKKLIQELMNADLPKKESDFAYNLQATYNADYESILRLAKANNYNELVKIAQKYV